jgi:hypothetical protein
MKSMAGSYRMIALTRSLDPKCDLLEWWEPGDLPYRGAVEFGDDEWDARTVGAELSHALCIFQELFRDGDLSDGLRQMRSRWNRKSR